MTLKGDLKEKFKDNLSLDVNLQNYSWFNLGGNVEFFSKLKIKIN